MAVTYEWRGDFDNVEVNELHAQAFETEVPDEAERNWTELVRTHSLGWVVARHGDDLVGFVNVIWDGYAHAWIEDTMVASRARGQGIGTRLVAMARDHARDSGCQWLHVDFGEHLRPFYLTSCGFAPSHGGLIALTQHRAG
jgi:GNAT superfamily N-acetyltransferase